jgi:hypothetical protein
MDQCSRRGECQGLSGFYHQWKEARIFVFQIREIAHDDGFMGMMVG